NKRIFFSFFAYLSQQSFSAFFFFLHFSRNALFPKSRDTTTIVLCFLRFFFSLHFARNALFPKSRDTTTIVLCILRSFSVPSLSSHHPFFSIPPSPNKAYIRY